MDIYLSCLLGGLVALAAFVLCGAGFHHPGVHHGEVSLGHKGHLSSNHHSLERSSAASNGSWTFSILTWLGWFSPLYEFVSLDFQCAEGRYKQEPADKTITAEQLFDARWALTLLSRAMNLLHQEYVLQGRASTFQILKIFLQSSDTPPSYEAAARALGLGLGATKTLIHRLRKQYTTILRKEIARTVSDPGEVEMEIHALCEALIASGGQLEP